jgi:hypothetical protein
LLPAGFQPLSALGQLRRRRALLGRPDRRSLGHPKPDRAKTRLVVAPKEVITKLNAAVQAVLSESNLRSRIAELGQEIFLREQQTPEGLATHNQKAEIEKWWPIIKAAGIKDGWSQRGQAAGRNGDLAHDRLRS